MPLYTVTVTNLTRGWTYSATEGDPWDPADDVVLISPLTYTWQFEGEVIPAQLRPVAAAVNLVARTASDVPTVQIGDLVTLDVRVGTTGPRIIAPPPMRVTEAETELVTVKHPNAYAARLSIGLTDLSVDWRARVPGHVVGYGASSPDAPRHRWRERMAEIGYLIGLPVGCPTWWDDDEGPLIPDPGNPGFDTPLVGADFTEYKSAAEDSLAGYINSHQPDGLTHTWTTVYSTSHPTGYEYVGAVTWWDDDAGDGISRALSEPAGTVRAEAVPASRKTSSDALPFTLADVGGVLVIVAVEPGAGDSCAQLGMSARWCQVPAKARRDRTNAINTVAIEGQYDPNDGPDGAGISDTTYTLTNASDVAARGSAPRTVPTKLFLGVKDVYQSQEVPVVAANFLSDESALDAPWTYDGFTLYSSEVPDAVAEWLLPLIPPRLPAETDGDGRLVRHVTVVDLAPEIRFGGAPVTGFITSGQMTIEGGDIVWTLRTTPGLPQRTGGAPAPITVGDLVDDFGALTFDDVDPHVTFADLAYVGAP
jgi:hypothetical protein